MSTGSVSLKLIDLISSKSSKEIESHLDQLSVNKSLGEQALSEQLAQRDSQGRTALHLAIMKGDFETIKVLLSFDAPITHQINNKSCEDYARELIGNPPQSERKRIYALIKSRGKWQTKAAHDQGIIFSRSMKAIVDAVDKIQGALNNAGVLFVGITGEGKSTFINYLSGVEYKIEEGDDLDERAVPTINKELAAVGHSTISCTSLPQTIPVKGKPYVWVDLPGFEDTRGIAEKICSAASICMLTKQLKLVQAIPFVVSVPSLKDKKLVVYRTAAENVGAMISKDPQAADNVILVVSKPGKVTEAAVRKKLSELSNDEKWDSALPATLIKREDLNEDAWRKHCLKIGTEAILTRKNNILLADITSSSARETFQNMIEGLTSQAKSPKQFDFNNYSKYMNQFQKVIESMIVHLNGLKREQKSIQETLKNLGGRVAEALKDNKSTENAIAKQEQQKSQPFTEETFNAKITEEKASLSALRKKREAQIKKLQDAELEMKISGAKLQGVEKEGERLIDTVHRDWVCEKTEDRIETEVTEMGPAMLADGTMAIKVKIDKKKIPGVEKTVSESVNYPSTVPIKRFVDRSHGGHFEAKGFAPDAMQLTGTFISTPGIHGGVGLSIELYGNVKDFPDTKDKINKFEQELKSAEAALDLSKQGAISGEEIETASEKVKKLELEKISAVGDHKRTQEICEMQIQFLKSQLNKNQAVLAELNKQQESEKLNLEDLVLQLEVNQDLFTKLLMVIKVMEFKGELIEQFQQLNS